MRQGALRIGSAALLAVAAIACGGGEASDSVENSPEAVPGMEESLAPTIGTGATDLPSEP